MECTKCFVDKSNSEFYKKTADRYYRWCKACFIHHTDTRNRNRKKQAIVRLGGKCNDCHEKFHPAIFDFHHKDPQDKEAEWRKMKSWSEERRNQELDKCLLLCANCHRMRHTTGDW